MDCLYEAMIPSSPFFGEQSDAADDLVAARVRLDELAHVLLEAIHLVGRIGKRGRVGSVERE